MTWRMTSWNLPSKLLFIVRLLSFSHVCHPWTRISAVPRLFPTIEPTQATEIKHVPFIGEPRGTFIYLEAPIWKNEQSLWWDLLVAMQLRESDTKTETCWSYKKLGTPMECRFRNAWSQRNIKKFWNNLNLWTSNLRQWNSHQNFGTNIIFRSCEFASGKKTSTIEPDPRLDALLTRLKVTDHSVETKDLRVKPKPNTVVHCQNM